MISGNYLSILIIVDWLLCCFLLIEVEDDEGFNTKELDELASSP